MNYKSIKSLELETTCVATSQSEWNNLMQGAVRGNHRIINSLVKKFLPGLYEELALHLHNPYHYYRTPYHLVLVHSNIEYFIRYE